MNPGGGEDLDDCGDLLDRFREEDGRRASPGGPITVRPGRFGAYVNWGKVNATIPKSVSPDDIGLGEAIDLIEEREGRPSGQRGVKKAAKSSGKAPAKAGAAKKAGAKAEPPFKPDVKAKPAASAAKKPASAAKSKAKLVKKPIAPAKRKA